MADRRRAAKRRAPLDSQFVSNELIEQEGALIDANNRTNPYLATRNDITAESVDFGLISNTPVNLVRGRGPAVSELGGH